MFKELCEEGRAKWFDAGFELFDELFLAPFPPLWTEKLSPRRAGVIISIEDYGMPFSCENSLLKAWW